MSKKLLIADDNPHNLELLKDVLERFRANGLEILTATDGEETYAAIQKEKPDLVLLDVMMPGMDGYQICEKLKADPKTKDIYVIMVTAQAEVEARRKAAGAGVDEYITKPFDIRLVRSRVQTILNLKPI
jgi:two-component system, OmpR family, alkaline phosphatase synthesis response regulator PhoP